MAKIVVIASINADVTGKVKDHPKTGETVKSEDFQYSTGGKGTNQAVAANRLGGDVRMAGKVGADAFGEMAKRFLATEKLDTKYVSDAQEVQTGAAFVAVNDKAQNVIYISSGANAKLTPDDVALISLESSDIVLATLETPIETTAVIFENAKKVGAKTILNAAPALLEARKLFVLSDYLVINETELATFADAGEIGSQDEAIASIKKLQLKDTVVIATLGERGVVAIEGSNVISVEAHKVTAVDTTAAGDCFVGAFVVALQERKTLRDSLEFANAAAALSVQKFGASSSMPRREDVESFLGKGLA